MRKSYFPPNVFHLGTYLIQIRHRSLADHRMQLYILSWTAKQSRKTSGGAA
jgi:hypothetical protein